MANAQQIKALIRSHEEGDDARFYAVALQVAAQAARSGHVRFARELRDLVDKAKARQRAGSRRGQTNPVPLAQPRGELAGLLSVVYPKTRMVDMALDEGLERQIRRVIREQRQRSRLLERGFSPIRKLLLIGPPGTGKTMTASALAGELSLPLFTVQLHSLITKFMGETAAKLRLVFEAIASRRGLYLFDEIDALASERGAGSDVGEIRRVLNSFLQFLEQDESDSLIVGATNHVGLLDHALFRRFDLVLSYDLPTEEIATRVMQARLALLDTSKVDWSLAAGAANGLSHAEVVRACDQSAKDALLNDSTEVQTADLVMALEERRSMRR